MGVARGGHAAKRTADKYAALNGRTAMSASPLSSGGHVRSLILGALAFLMVTTTAFAQAPEHAGQSQPRPSEESLRHLLEVTQAKKVLQTVTEQMDATFDAMVKQQLGGQQNLTPEQ